MPRNPYIRDVQREQEFLEDINVEVIRAMGRNVYYIPRTLNNEDKIFGEDPTDSFDTAYLIEMYHEDGQAFGGEGDTIGKFGIDVRDTATFRVARRTFMQQVTKQNGELTRPMEGDLIYYPLSDTIFQITFVEHENPLYQLGQLYSFVLFVETFAYNNESFNTGMCEVDECFAAQRRQTAEIFTMADWGGVAGSTSNYFIGETVFQVGGTWGLPAIIGHATAKAQVIDWDSTDALLTVGNVSGTFLDGAAQSIKGSSSRGERFLGTTAPADFGVQINTQNEEMQGDNETIQLEIKEEDLIDFSETDPFSEGNF